MLDHRTRTAISPGATTTSEFIWTREAHQYCWAALRGIYEPLDGRAGWFSPPLAEDLSGLPATYIAVGSLDLFLEENLAYAHRLAGAGVPLELHVYAGAVHAFQLVATASVSKAYQRDLQSALARLLGI